MGPKKKGEDVISDSGEGVEWSGEGRSTEMWEVIWIARMAFVRGEEVDVVDVSYLVNSFFSTYMRDTCGVPPFVIAPDVIPQNSLSLSKCKGNSPNAKFCDPASN